MPSQVTELVAEILEREAASVGETDDLEALGWDSLSDLTFLSIADERYGRTIDSAALSGCETPADLAKLLA